jgi:hypothetical protein
LLFCLITCLTMTAPAADLSPSNWPAAEKAQAERQEQTVFPPKARLIEGRSAADAASTIALTQITTADRWGTVAHAPGVPCRHSCRHKPLWATDWIFKPLWKHLRCSTNSSRPWRRDRITARIEVLTIKGTAVVGAVNPETSNWRALETPALFGFANAY